MSGQPYRYASDPERYRAMYMENLNNVAKMDDLVLQAVKEYTQTGMIPPAAQLIDNRTTSEKLADIEKLKIGIVKDLEPIMDNQTALTLVKGLSQSPLNSDNKLIIFFAQTGKAIIDKLKEQYKYGIKGDANDIETFVDFINSAYNKKLAGVQSVKELLLSTQGGRDLVNATAMDQYLRKLSEIIPSLTGINRRTGTPADPMLAGKIQNLLQMIRGVGAALPTDDEQAMMRQLINRGLSNNPSLYSLCFDIMRTELPKKEVIDSLLNQINGAVNGNNIALAEQIIDNLYGMFSGFANEFETMQRAKDQVIAETPRAAVPGIRYPPAPPPGAGIPPLQPAPYGYGLRKRPGRPKGSGIPLHLKIDPNFKVEPMPQYTQFGKFLINNHRLSEDIMSLRSGKGHVIKDMPPFKLSPQFKKVVKKITGGSIPTEDDINSLTDEEIKYLNKLSKRANVYDALNIPTPSKSKEEQDMHDFEVMKGEIMSGNDNSGLIKKFKILLMRFHKQGRIPKNEYHEIMEDLMTLGI